MKIEINGREVKLLVTVWVADENRVGKLLIGREDSKILQLAALIYIPHLNWCRRAKTDPVVSLEDIELWVEDQLTDKATRANVNTLIADISNEISQMFTEDESAVKENGNGQKKTSGEVYEALPLAVLT